LEIEDDWGQQLVSEGCFVPVVLDVISDEIIVLDGVPDHFSAGQVGRNNCHKVLKETSDEACCFQGLARWRFANNH